MTRILPILTSPNNILRQESTPINTEDISAREFQELCFSMAETMLKNKGIGLAAPQIGQNIRLIVVNLKDGPIWLVNPNITWRSLTTEFGEEGCLSVPETFGQVKRNKKITVKFTDINGREVKIRAQGLLARVMQHEIDHLDGVLFIDKAKNIEHISAEERESKKSM
jgi:peptide deformylase